MRRRIGAGRIRGEGYKGSLWLPEGSKLPGILRVTYYEKEVA